MAPSAGPSTHKRIGRGVCNFDSDVWDGEKQNAVLAGTYAKFTQKPAMKNRLLSNKRLAEASPLNPVWGIGLRADNPRTNDSRQWRREICSVRHVLPFTKPFVKVRPSQHTPPPLADSVPPRGMLELTRFRQRRSRAR